MKRTSSCLLLLILLVLPARAQYVTQGPAIGAVTHHSANMYLRTTETATYLVQLSTNAELTDPLEFTASSRDNLDFSAIVEFTGLQAATRYYYSVWVNSRKDTITGHFRTYPEPGTRGTYAFVTGSCQETENMKVFDLIPKYEPYFMMHTGDYTYPDYQIKPDYAADYDLMAYSYQKRYDEKEMKQMLHTVPIDYVYDDNDYVGGSGGRYMKNDNSQYSKLGFNATSKFYVDTFPPFWRSNCIKGYMDFFPGYDMVDTNVGIHHSFKFGNAEFFVLDRCSNKPHGNGYAFRWDEKHERWVFDPPSDHVLYGKEQMDWLKAGLKNSTADWKFIVSGVPFNKNLGLLIEAGMKYQNFGWEGNTGFRVASGFSHYWAGHPTELYDFLNFLEAEDIKDVIAISGDTHHNLMDDGRNAGIPELNASGLSVTGTELGLALNWLGKISGYYKFRKHIWNQGGNGIKNTNMKNAFGHVKIVENEYVELSIIDEDDTEIACMRVFHSSNTDTPRRWKKRDCE